MSRSAYERKLARLFALAERLGPARAGQLTLLASDANHAAPAADGEAEHEFLALMTETLGDVAAERSRFNLG